MASLAEKPAETGGGETARPAGLRQGRPRWSATLPEKLRGPLLGTLSLLAFLGFWYVLTTWRLDLYVRFVNVPTPQAVFQRALVALHDDRFATHIFVSLRRIAVGFCLAAWLAVPCGLMLGRFALLRQIALPPIEILRPIPAIAWVPMSIMLWPTSEQSIVFITFLGSFFPILLNTLHGAAIIDPMVVRAARCLGADQRTLFLEVYLPSALPHIFTGLTVGMGVAWVSLIAAEMISGQFGIGYFTWEAYSLVQYPDICLGMALIGVLGLGCSGLIRWIGTRLMPWTHGRRHAPIWAGRLWTRRS